MASGDVNLIEGTSQVIRDGRYPHNTLLKSCEILALLSR